MSTQRRRIGNERGMALIYMTVTLSALMLFAGLATDGGRAYVVKAQLSKAVDGAALAGARMLNSGNPAAEARKVFEANFPPGYLGTSGSATMSFNVRTDEERDENIVTVSGSVQMPTTFMRLGDIETVTVSSDAEARRRMVDLSLVLDVSSSIGSRWGAVRDASRTFVEAFDAAHDRVSLVTYGNGAKVVAQMPSTRGFNKSWTSAAIPDTLPGGSTAMVEGLYRGWDELRAVGAGQQSSLRVIVLFTDGASNSVPAFYDVSSGSAKGLRTFDFPKNNPDPDGQTWDNPTIAGLFDTETGAASPSYSLQVSNWNNTTTLSQVPYLPMTSAHTHRRGGTPSSFPLQSAQLTVNGVAQSTARGLRNKNTSTNRYPADVFNINNAARNLVEIIADAARSDTAGDYRIRIYTIGMGELVRYRLGTLREKSEDILMRIANDDRSPDYNAGQLEGKYYFAASEGDVGAAFQSLQNEIIRLSK